PLHCTSPSFLTAHTNMTSASFWPFLIKSCSSMRLISAPGPCPINTGRNVGPAAGFDGVVLVCAVGVALVCARARSTIDSKTIRTDASARMARYASGAQKFFKREVGEVYVATGAYLSRPFLDRDTKCGEPCGEIECALDRMAVAETQNPSGRRKHILC